MRIIAERDPAGDGQTTGGGVRLFFRESVPYFHVILVLCNGGGARLKKYYGARRARCGDPSAASRAITLDTFRVERP